MDFMDYMSGGSIELALTSSVEIDAWITKYSGAYTCASTMHVFDYQGVLQEVAINKYAIYGARLSAGVWYNTEADGITPLTNTIGMAFWPTATNVIGSAQYRDFTHADWNVTNCSITAGAVTLIDGTSVSDKNTLTASGANGTIILDPYTSVSGVHAGGVFIKRKTGTGAIEVTVDGGSTWVAVTTQVAGDSGWHLCQTTLPTVTDPEFGVRLVTSGDAVYLDFAQMDDGKARVSVHPIEGGATLAAQSMIAADATNSPTLIVDVKGAVYAEAQLLPDDFSILKAYIISGGNASSRILVSDNGSDDLQSSDGTNALTFSNGIISYTKAVSYWWDSSKQISSNGSSSSAGNYDGSWTVGTIYIGSRQPGVSQFNGIINKVVFYPNQPKTQAFWEDLTS